MSRRTISPEELVNTKEMTSYSEINNNDTSRNQPRKNFFLNFNWNDKSSNKKNTADVLLSVSPDSMKSPDSDAHENDLRSRVRHIMNSAAIQTFSSLLLLLSLFMTDSFILGNAPDSMNNSLYGTMSVILGIFIVEITVMSLVENNYAFSFFFWLDLIGTISLILDIGWISQLFIPSGAINAQGSLLISLLCSMQ